MEASERGGYWLRDRGEWGSGGSGGKGGGRRASSEEGDGGLRAEAPPGIDQQFCIGNWVREKN